MYSSVIFTHAVSCDIENKVFFKAKLDIVATGEVHLMSDCFL